MNGEAEAQFIVVFLHGMNGEAAMKVVEHCFIHGSGVELEFLLFFLQIKEAAIPQVGGALWTTDPHFLVKTGFVQPEFGISDSSALQPL